MKIYFKHVFANLGAGYWFIPSVMALAAIALSIGLVVLDRTLAWEAPPTGGLFVSADGGREVLAVIATAMITVAGVVFSITIVALQLAANELGHRVLRTFRQDRGSQIVLGTFTATFLYSLLVLRSVVGDGDDQELFVPFISVAVAIFLAVGGVVVLIYFIHHLAKLIQAPYIIGHVARDLDDVIDATWKRTGADYSPESGSAHELPPDFDERACAIPATRDGYVQALNDARVIEVAARHNLIIELPHRPGHFITREQSIANVYPENAVDKNLVDTLRDCVVVGNERSPVQDLGYAFDALSEIAARGLSPAINDPFIVVNCVDRACAAIGRLASRPLPGKYRTGPDNRLRAIIEPQSFESLASAAFDKVRQYGREHPAVLIRLLERLEIATKMAAVEAYRDVLLTHADRINRAGQQHFFDDHDRRILAERHANIFATARAARE